MKGTGKSLFDQQYRVVAVESDRLLIRGILSGDVLTIVNSEPPDTSFARKTIRQES
jgi:hypothetical protein